jgi:GT2 family glycosyltransferase
VAYSDLLQDWRTCTERISIALDMAWPIPASDVEKLIDEHLRHDLAHQKVAATKALLPVAWRDDLDRLYEAVVKGFGSELEAELVKLQRFLEYSEPVIQNILPPSTLHDREAELAQAKQSSAAYQVEAGRLFDEKRLLMVAHEADLRQMQSDRVAHANEVTRLESALHEMQGQLMVLKDEETADAERLASAKEDLERLSAELARVNAKLAYANDELTHARGEAAKAIAWKGRLDAARSELELIKHSRSWRMSKPLRFVARTARQGGLTHGDRQRLADIFSRRNGSSKLQAVVGSHDIWNGQSNELPLEIGFPVAEPVNGKRDFFFWAVIDWHFRMQRPQHLARELATLGHRSFYISNNFVDHTAPGFEVESLDDSGRLFQIKLHLKGAPSVYSTVPSHDALRQLQASVGLLLAWSKSLACVSLVQHPFWLETARMLPNVILTYDCMDHHGGFADNTPEILAREAELMKTADLLVVTSDWLYEEATKYNNNRLMVRNACQFEHFAEQPSDHFRDMHGRAVIGYYGAIAEWFDLDLLEKVAISFPDSLVLLIGADTAGAKDRLKHLPNVEFLGEKPYSELPFYLHGFDLCLLPFKVLPLTLATNPVKVYEYLSAGKEVVSIELPEMKQFGELVRVAADHDAFVAAVGKALRKEPASATSGEKERFAAEQTWGHRASDLVEGISRLHASQVSVIVVTYNNLELTKACLQSLELHTMYPTLEIIVVDNASSDGTQAYLKQWASKADGRRIILNDDNRGFAAANNQGLEAASGEYLVLLNNDTYVTPGWLATLINHLRLNPTIGLIGPVTNNIGNEARIDISYEGMDEMIIASRRYTSIHAGQLTPLRTAAFFCVMFSRAVYDAVGALDEAFGIGFFEDDDYCRRVERAGWSIACADDVFVHHHLSASFNKLKQEKRQALFEQNRAIYEKKWGPWMPHVYRGS